jgi:large subunit ribosomal protein L9
MKVILNKDLATLGEEGDVKDVARGYARNYLFPRGIALPYTPQTVKLFEARKEEIDAKKAQKRQDALGLKERLEGTEISITMPAGANGRLYGAVTSLTVSDELAKLGFQIERKRIDLASAGLKTAGKYKASIKLYENSSAEIQITVIGQAVKSETPHAPARPTRRRRDEGQETAPATGPEDTTPAAGPEGVPQSEVSAAGEPVVTELATVETPVTEPAASAGEAQAAENVSSGDNA